MSSLERYEPGGSLVRPPGMSLDARRQGKELAHNRRGVRNDVALAKDKVDGAAHIAEHSMYRLAEVDSVRRQLAGHDEGLNNAMIEVELNYLRAVARVQNALFRDA